MGTKLFERTGAGFEGGVRAVGEASAGAALLERCAE